ncbi:F-box protein SKIP28 [Apostasia shenzhenica]|uniref:F-box protein SKIP28 n=1 Tax=Apostasia shenzhenica TaxID=1088818 RepID=A0A2I0B0L2_9ASPA|nr:F-box protein SKIP28 [Apostasia shenzhenica]
MDNPSSTSDSLLAGSSGGAAELRGALFLVLEYLRLPELLTLRQVCRAYRDSIAADELIWRHISVEPPLNSRLTDDALLRITSFTRGNLTSLALLDCRRITDDGLLQVVNRNPSIKKLYIPGCSSLTPDGIVRVVKQLAEHNGYLECLRLQGLHQIKAVHFHVLNSLLYQSNPRAASHPHFYRDFCSVRYNIDDGRPMDVDICPKCNNVRMIFDCPREDCRMMRNKRNACRGCFLCIERCGECGGCLDPEEVVEEIACLHLLCAGCWLHLPKCTTCNSPCCKQDAAAFGFSSADFALPTSSFGLSLLPTLKSCGI